MHESTYQGMIILPISSCISIYILDYCLASMLCLACLISLLVGG